MDLGDFWHFASGAPTISFWKGPRGEAMGVGLSSFLLEPLSHSPYIPCLARSIFTRCFWKGLSTHHCALRHAEHEAHFLQSGDTVAGDSC